MADFDVSGARKVGYSDAEIADHLGQQSSFDVAGARKAGYGDADIIAHLLPAKSIQTSGGGVAPGSGQKAKTTPDAMKVEIAGTGAPSAKADVGASGEDFSVGNDLAHGIYRGAKGVIDTGAEWLARGFDKLAGTDEGARVAALNAADKADTATRYNPASLLAKAGELGGQVIATSPIGAALSAPVRAAALMAPRLAPLANAIATSGMTTGNAARGVGPILADLGTRAAGGAATNALSTALINPDDAAVGAGVGAALPVVMSGAGAAGRLAGRLIGPSVGAVAGGAAGAAATDGSTPGMVGGATLGALGGLRGVSRNSQSAARSLLDATGGDSNALIALLRNAEELVPGSRPTVSQALGTNPGASALEDIIHDATLNNALRDARQSQNVARTNALEAIAPTGATGLSEAKNDLGQTITRRVIPEERRTSAAISQQYRAVDPNGSETINLPIDAMQAAVDRYAGRGTFNANADPNAAVRTARSLSAPETPEAASTILDASGNPMRPAGEATPRAATWDEVSSLRASLNKALRAANLDGDRQAVAALGAQKTAIDAAIARDLSPEAQAAWTEANASHAAKMGRFHTGPQSSIFRTAPNGEPAVQGGEVSSKFWGARPGLADDVTAFRRLVDDNPDMLGRFRSMVTTEGAGTAKASGDLTSKFSKWVTERLPGLRAAFDPADVEALQRIAQDIDRSEAAHAAAGVRGSKSTQGVTNALNLGLLDNSGIGAIADRIPMGRAGLDLLRGRARDSKANRLADLLADPQSAANALEVLTRRNAVNPPGSLGQLPYLLAPALSAQ